MFEIVLNKNKYINKNWKFLNKLNNPAARRFSSKTFSGSIYYPEFEWQNSKIINISLIRIYIFFKVLQIK